MARMAPDPTDLKSSERRALTALAKADKPLSKGQLAREVFGDVTGSTQAMVTRVTQSLATLGLIEERQDGRFRHVAITDVGKRALPKLSDRTLRGGWESVLRLEIEDPGGGLRPVRYYPPEARNINHLHGAAVLAINYLAPRSTSQAADERFAQAMLVLIDEKQNAHEEATHDLLTIRSLAASWPQRDLGRARLVELLALIEDPIERSRNAPELARDLLQLAGESLSSPPTALLWSAGAGSILGPLRTATEKITELRPKLVEALRESLRAAQPVSPGMAKYWRARSLVGLGALTVASFDWPHFGNRLDTTGNDELARKAHKVTEDVLASGEVNIPLLKLERLEDEGLLPRVEQRHGPKLPASPLECIEAIFEDRDGWCDIWRTERTRLLAESSAFRSATDELFALPKRLEEGASTEVSAFPVAEEHIFRCGGLISKEPAPIADGDLKQKLQTQVQDNLWSKSMVLGYVSALHHRDLIYPNPLS
jgi:DNA-binding MarR family transcriptional regulator